MELLCISLQMPQAYMLHGPQFWFMCLQDLCQLPLMYIDLTLWLRHPFLQLTPSFVKYEKYEAPHVFLWITLPSSRNRRSSYQNSNFQIPSPSTFLEAYLCAPTLKSSMSVSSFAVDLCGIRFLPEASKGCNFADPVALSLTSKFKKIAQDDLHCVYAAYVCCLC